MRRQIYRDAKSTELLGTVEGTVTLWTRENAFRADPKDSRDPRLFMTEAAAVAFLLEPQPSEPRPVDYEYQDKLDD